MELKIYSPDSDGFVKEIRWNHEEIKRELAEKMSYYTDLVYTDDQISAAKKDRATLRKFVKALDDKRKDIKNQCLAPYMEFERQLQDIIALVNEPITMIDTQIKAVEDERRAQKRAKLVEYWRTVELPFTVEFERIERTKWSNATVSIDTAKKEMEDIAVKISNEYEAISGMPEISFYAAEHYRATLDFVASVNEAKRLAEISRRKDAAEKSEDVDKQDSQPDFEPVRQPVSFRAWLTVDDAKALREFFIDRGIKFISI